MLLLARTQGGSTDVARAASLELERWRAAAPAHEEAYRRATALWSATSADELQSQVDLPMGQTERRAQARQNRRRALTLLGLTGISFFTAGSTRSYWSLAIPRVLETARGEMATETLPDGTVVDLAARTRAVVSYYPERREVRLETGAARFQVRHDPDRPFFVQTNWGHVRVLGTIFTVSAHGAMVVEVAEGRVGVWTGGRDARMISAETEPPVLLIAGQRVRADAGGLGVPGVVSPADVGAWRRGWLIFDNELLSRVVATWNDYLDSPFRLDPSALSDQLRLTGSFPIRDPEAFLSSLPGILPVRVQRSATGVALISGRR
ncbi:FecR family protein [Achromobacter aloeverae]